MINEVWKPIVNFEGLYEISSLGRVKSLSKEICNNRRCYLSKEKILKHSTTKSGYFMIILCKNGKKKGIKIHQLVAQSFLNHTICGQKLVVDHINDVKTDNRPSE